LLSLEGYNISDKISIDIYDVTGKKVMDFIVPINQNSQYNISKNLQLLSGGIYLLQVNKKETIKFVKK